MAALGSLAGASIPATASAGEPSGPGPAFLRVTREAGAEACPDAQALLARVEEVRGHRTTGEIASYQVTFSERGGVFRASIQVGAGSVRELLDRGASCESLEQATAVTLALLLDASEAEPQAPAPARPSVGVPSALPSPPPTAPERPRSRPWVTLDVGGGALLGVTRAAAPLLHAGVGIGVGRFRTTLGAFWMPTQALTLGPGQLDEQLRGGAARMCWSPWSSGALRLDLCSGIHAGIVKVTARGYTRDGEAEKPWLALPLELSLSTRAAPIGFEIGPTALLPLRRHDFSIDGLGVAYESWPVGALLSARLLGAWVL